MFSSVEFTHSRFGFGQYLNGKEEETKKNYTTNIVFSSLFCVFRIEFNLIDSIKVALFSLASSVTHFYSLQ